MRQIIFFISFYLVVNVALHAQAPEGNFSPPPQPRVVKALRSTDPIRVDGRLSESSWEDAPETSDFFKIEPRQGGGYLYETKAKILFDSKNLYVGFFCADSLGRKGVRAQDLRRDFDSRENDIVGIQLDPQNLKQYCVSFQTTPYGNQRDLQNFNDSQTDNDWNSLWTVRTFQTDSGYFAEFAIPFKSLRYDKPIPGEPVSWGMTMTRLARRDFEQTVFPAIPQSYSPYRMTYAAKLEGLDLPPPSANVRVEPYFLNQNERTSQAGERNTHNNLKIGGEVKWAINPRSVLDFTVNTDFAQADVDRAVNNLERFNIFFPERRQFFLENSGIWAGGLQTSIRPFFSRRIGLQGDFNATPAPIDAGTRFTLRDEKKAIAGLYMHQRETENSAAASFSVMRYLKNYSKENNIGVMLTHRLDEASSSLGVENKNNATLTIDGLIRPKSEWTIQYLLSGSRDYETNINGTAGRIFVGHSPNKHYWGWVTEFTDKNYNPAIGFVRQKNVLRHNPGGYWILRPKSLPWIRRWDPGFFADYYHDADNPGNFQQASLYLFPVYIFFKDNSFFEYAIYTNWQNINFNFAPLGLPIAQGEYYYVNHRVKFNTDQSKKFSANGIYNWGDFYNGKKETVNAGFRLAPDPHVAFTADYEFNKLKKIGEDKRNLDTHLVTGGVRLAWNPRIQLSAFYQYNSYDEQGRWNVRASWEYRPLSFIYFVFNDTQTDLLEGPISNHQLIGKITFLKQF
ncbi:MAG: DUF5916 domain-containing protein [Cyclobacteriaceae bacterium]